MPIWSDGGQTINHEPYFIGGFILFVAVMGFATVVAIVSPDNPRVVLNQLPILKYIIGGLIVLGIAFIVEGKKIYLKAIAEFGAEAQIVTAIEEMSELTHTLTKVLRNKGTYTEQLAAVTEEVADVEIMLGQIRVMFDLPSGYWKQGEFSSRVKVEKERKLALLQAMLKSGLRLKTKKEETV